MTSKEFKTEVNKAFNNPEMGGCLYNALTTPKSSNNIVETKYFCLSEKNIGLAIKYAKFGNDDQLKKDCENVLLKIADGPVMMKQMLRKAQLKYAENC